MAAALGDLIRIVDNQTYLNEPLMNVYWYRVTSVTGFTDDGYEAMADWFVDTVVDPVRAIQSDGLLHTTLQVVNMTNGIDFFEENINLPGTIASGTGEDAPSNLSYGFRLIRESLVTRNGYKRFAGVVDGGMDGNDIALNPTDVTAIEDALSADVVIGIATLAEPVIVKHPVGSPPVASYLYSSIGDAVVAAHVGTQNTRKPRS